ncbi:MAG TPA: methyltransferase [Treponemataceae bacterium]|nr:methyltransferase [Treponemataceae bacterium]
MEIWNNAGGTLKMGRFPYDAEDRGLRAWNGADTLIIEHLKIFADGNAGAGNNCAGVKRLNVLILNDSFGALSVAALNLGHSVRLQSDSAVTRIAFAKNCEMNKIEGIEKTDDSEPPKFTLIDSLSPLDFSTWQPDIVLMQIPKSTLLLEFQLTFLTTVLPAGIPICAGAMTRDVHNSTINLFETIIGPTKTSLAAHKARLIHSTFTGEAAKPSVLKKTETSWPRIQKLSEEGLPELDLFNHAGVFSASGHDKGSLTLLHYIAEIKNDLEQCIIDCGCGNGLLALVAAKLFPHSKLICADESFMAVESARAGFTHNNIAERADFVWTDCLNGVENEKADLILCNPPFHSGMGQTQTISIAQRMFEDSRRCLKPSGKLLVVTNGHLGHNRYLESLFTQVSIVRENERFVVIEAKNLD